MDCAHCAIATDYTLAGSPTPALSDGPSPPSVVSQHFRRSWIRHPTYDAIVGEMEGAGEGARGIVMGQRARGSGHVFNVVHDHNGVVFVDGQVGFFATLESYKRLYLLRTD